MAAGATYEPIASVTSTGQTTISFNSIPQTYTDLVLIGNGAYSGTTYGSFKFNNVTGSTSYTRFLGYSTTAISDRDATSDGFSLGATRGSVIANIQNYSSTSIQKIMLLRENTHADGLGVYVYLWRNTAAITQIDITAKASGTFISGSMFTLYGIKAA